MLDGATVGRLTPIEVEILWQKLLSILEERSWIIVRTSYSTAVREAGDFGCLLYDDNGNLVCQNTTVASKIGVFHSILPTLLEAQREGRLQVEPGDVLVCNDVWLTEGHLYDVSVVMPIFHDEDVIGYVECIAHISDIGGALTNTARDIFEEGLQIPLSRIVKAGREDPEIVAFIERNVRVPAYAMGDIRSLISCARGVAADVDALATQIGTGKFHELTREVLDRTESAARQGIRQSLRDGVYEGDVHGDGSTAGGLHIHAKVTVTDGAVEVDFSGSSDQQPIGINCPANYAYAWTVFTIKTLACPELPNNAGAFRAVTTTAPAGSVLNPTREAPVRNRASTAHFIAPAICNALQDAVVGDRLVAESGSPLWLQRFFGVRTDGSRFAEMTMLNGGMGARLCGDGPSATAFPSNAGSTSVEVIERVLPMRILRKSLIAGSGGPGRYRGGCGQHVVVEITDCKSLRVLFMHERTEHPAQGMRGGLPGAPGRALLNGVELPPKGEADLRPGDVLEFFLPGGGGVGDPRDRDPAAVAEDAANGLDRPSSADETTTTAGAR